jgi:4-aminobutyrate aminotransferase-like enzyme
VGRADVFRSLAYGEGSDTWSANPLSSAAVLATLDEFATRDVLASCRTASAVIEAGLLRLKRFPFIAHVRGEAGGMVWGIEMADHAGRPAAEWASQLILAAYQGDGPTGIHLLGPLAKKVIRIAPPLVIADDEAAAAVDLLDRAARRLADSPPAVPHAD